MSAAKRGTTSTIATIVTTLFALTIPSAYAATDSLLAKTPKDLPWCGSIYAPPFAIEEDGKTKRTCESPSARAYTPAHQNIGTEALNIESKACFVPDSAYQLLDHIIDTVKERIGAIDTNLDHEAQRTLVLKVSRTTGQVMAEKGFGLYIPTATLGDALVPRSPPDVSPRYVVDCDTSSLILMSVAEALGLKAALVEVTLSSGSGHNFVRWQLNDNSILDWDTNGQAECSMQLNNPRFQGKAQTHDQTTAYLLLLAGGRSEREGHVAQAVDEYRRSTKLNPEHPAAYNNFVWSVATKVFPERESLKGEATADVELFLALRRIPDYLDTAACMAAYNGDFKSALAYEREAFKGDPGNKSLKDRVHQLASAHPHDCTGEE